MSLSVCICTCPILIPLLGLYYEYLLDVLVGILLVYMGQFPPRPISPTQNSRAARAMVHCLVYLSTLDFAVVYERARSRPGQNLLSKNPASIPLDMPQTQEQWGSTRHYQKISKRWMSSSPGVSTTPTRLQCPPPDNTMGI